MAQAIKTKYYMDNNGNSKISVSCEAGRKVYFWHDFKTQEPKEIHISACLEFRKFLANRDFKEFKHPIEKNHWLKPMLCGGLKDCMVHVFLE